MNTIRWWSREPLLVVLLLLSLGVVGLQMRRIALLEMALHPRPAVTLKVGSGVPPLVAKSLDGQTVTIDYTTQAKPTLLYVFSPTCAWCNKNVDAWSNLVAQAGSRYRIYGIALDVKGMAEFLTKHATGFRVVTGLSREQVQTYKLGSTPETIVVSPKGTVLASWSGAYLPGLQKQIEWFFSVNLSARVHQ